MNITQNTPTNSPAGPAEPISSMDRFEAAVTRNRAEFNEAIQRRELAHAHIGMPIATLRQRRALSAVKRGKSAPPAFPVTRSRSLPIAILARDQENEYGEFSDAALASKLLQATMHDFPTEMRGRAWASGKRRSLVRDTIPYAKYIDSQLAFAGRVPSYTQDPPSFNRERPKVFTYDPRGCIRGSSPVVVNIAAAPPTERADALKRIRDSLAKRN